MKKVIAIIFGGSGYIGKNLLSKLLEEERFDSYYIVDKTPLHNFDEEKIKEKSSKKNF